MNTELTVSSQESIQKYADNIFEDMEPPILWQKSCIILVVYRSEFVCTAVQELLKQRFAGIGQTLVQIPIDRTQFDIPFILLEHPARSQSIFSILGLRWGGGRGGNNAYRSLNLHREYLVDGCVRVIFWLTPKEAARLPRIAPDFWAFRQRSFEIFDLPRLEDMHPFAEDILLGNWQQVTSIQDFDTEISIRKRILAGLPDTVASRNTRAEIHAYLGSLFWAKGEPSTAIQHLETSLYLAGELKDNLNQSELYRGLGIVYQTMGNYQAAIRAYQGSIANHANDQTALGNLAIIYQKMGCFEDALNSAEQAIQFNPESAEVWLVRGNIYANMGFFEDAVSSYKKAARLRPDYALVSYRLGQVFYRWGGRRLAARYFRKAAQLGVHEEQGYCRTAG